MKRPAPSLLVASLALAWSAHADTIGPVQGNALNPAPINPVTHGRWMDEEGIGTRIPSARTPTGQHYNIPLDTEGEAPEPKVRDWTTVGFVELGFLVTGGDDRAALFRTYKDLRSGGYLNAFGVLAEKPDQARYFEATGGGVGRDDQFYRAQFGRYNDWKVTAFYDGTPQVFTSTYRSLWNGVGSSNLALATLTPGGTTNAATTQTNIQNAVAATPESDLQVVRKRAGVRYDKTLGESWKLHATVTDEKREGARPFGAVFGGGGGGGNMEIPESVDYHTTELSAGAQWNDAVSSFNIRASASFFRNEIDTLTFQNPIFINLNGSTGLTPQSFTQGRFDLAPDNQSYNVKGEYARALPDLWRGHLTGTVSLGSMRQDDNLLAPTEYSLAGGTVTAGGVSLANNWNTPTALTRQTANTRIDTALADFSATFRPARTLDLRGKIRYYELRNEGEPYVSCNPLTGQFGRILNEGSGLSLVGAPGNAFNATQCNLEAARALGIVPTTGNVPIASALYDYRQLVGNVAADWRLGKASSLTAALERETYRRDNREREETSEDKFRVGYVDRGLIDGSIRLSYEHDRRGGGEYNPNPYEPYLSASLGPHPAAGTVNVQTWFHSIAQFRSFDLADRNQNLLNGRVDYSWGSFDGALSAQVKDASFPGQYGRTGHQKTGSISLDLTYQSGSAAVMYANYTHQRGELEQRGVHPNACSIGQTYYFYSDGRVLSAAAGAPPPATPDGTTLVTTQSITGGNWFDTCGMASPPSPLFPESRAWEVVSKDRSDVLGLGIKYDLGKAKLDANFTRALGRTQIGYTYNAAALGLSPAQAALAGSGMSDLTLAQNILNATMWVPLDKNMQLRLLVRYETGKVHDWHYDGLAANPMPASNAVYLDSGPRDYRTTVVGVMLHLRM